MLISSNANLLCVAITAAHQILQTAYDDSTDDVRKQLDNSEQALFSVSQNIL